MFYQANVRSRFYIPIERELKLALHVNFVSSSLEHISSLVAKSRGGTAEGSVRRALVLDQILGCELECGCSSGPNSGPEVTSQIMSQFRSEDEEPLRLRRDLWLTLL